MIRISLIAAVAENHVIGLNNQLPWYLPEDLKYFKRNTLHKIILMGRVTYESIGILPDRTSVVLTRDRNFTAPCAVVHGLAAAFALFKKLSVTHNSSEIMIIGGAEIYTLFLPYASLIYLTCVQCNTQGDTYFPALNDQDWKILSFSDRMLSSSGISYSFKILERSSLVPQFNY